MPRLSDLSVGFLKKPTTKTKAKLQELPPPSIAIRETKETPLQIPEVQQIAQIPGIEPFLIRELIPDLVYLFKRGGLEAVREAVERADPSDPQSLIFNHPFQDEHRATQKVEIELILNKPEIAERPDTQCISCGSRRIQTALIQTRRADEALTVFARCVDCNRRWKFSAA